MKQRLDKALVLQGLVPTRSQAESWIKLGKVTVNGQTATKPGLFVDDMAMLALTASEQYVSRAGLKLASVVGVFKVDFTGKTVLDVGSSTGGFTDYALQHGAAKVIAVDVGTDQLHPSLRADARVELHEKTDIRSVELRGRSQEVKNNTVMIDSPDIVVIDVSFISLREILPHVSTLLTGHSVVFAMVKPQFEAGKGQLGNSGVVKNDRARREILRDFEQWAKQFFVILQKADSEIKGANGNQERFYLLKNIG